MIDIQYVRDNPAIVKQKSLEKGYDVDIDQLLGFDKKWREILLKVEELRRQKNELSSETNGQKPSEDHLVKAKNIKEQLGALEHQLQTIEKEFKVLLARVPNMPLDYVPVGDNEEKNVIAKTVGEKPTFDFEPRSHWELLNMRGMLDKERATKIAGSRFVYLKGNIVLLQFALVQYVFGTLGNKDLIQKIIDENNLEILPKTFQPVIPPALLKTEPYIASARLNAEEVTYKIENDDLWLNASAEHTMCTMYWNEILPEEHLPIRYVAYSPSFRREAGTYGKDTEGIIRLHQFDKLELETFSTAKTGLDEHKLMVALQEHLVGSLNINYQVLQKCTFDIGKPNATGVDINCWFPGQNKYIETHTADYMTDYQARDLNIRVKKATGENELVHTNDGTAFALGRILASIIENYQEKDGSIGIPDVLKPYMGNKEKI